MTAKNTKKTMTPQEKGEKWLKDNNAKQGLFVVTNKFAEKKINTKKGERIQFSFSVVPVKKGSKFDIKNSIYMSALVDPENKSRVEELRNITKHRYGITYRDNESDYKGKTHVFHNLIKAFPAYKQA